MRQSKYIIVIGLLCVVGPAGIDSVEFGTCAYRPSQTLPLFGKPLS